MDEQVGAQHPHADFPGAFKELGEEFFVFGEIVFEAEMLGEGEVFELGCFHE